MKPLIAIRRMTRPPAAATNCCNRSSAYVSPLFCTWHRRSAACPCCSAAVAAAVAAAAASAPSDARASRRRSPYSWRGQWIEVDLVPCLPRICRTQCQRLAEQRPTTAALATKHFARRILFFRARRLRSGDDTRPHSYRLADNAPRRNEYITMVGVDWCNINALLSFTRLAANYLHCVTESWRAFVWL